MTERTVVPIPSDSQRKPRCKWVNKHPYQICREPAVIDIVIRTEASAKRRSWELHYEVCETHVPRSVRPPISEAPPEEGMISAEEAAEIIGVGVMTIHGWRRPGRRRKGPRAVKAGRRYWYRRSEVESFAEAYRSLNDWGNDG